MSLKPGIHEFVFIVIRDKGIGEVIRVSVSENVFASDRYAVVFTCHRFTVRSLGASRSLSSGVARAAVCGIDDRGDLRGVPVAIESRCRENIIRIAGRNHSAFSAWGYLG